MKCTCEGLFASCYHAKIKSNNGKNTQLLCVTKNYSTSHIGIGGCKKEEKISKSKTITVTYFDGLKKKQQDQGGKNWCCTENYVSLTISNLRTTAFCFENKF